MRAMFRIRSLGAALLLGLSTFCAAATAPSSVYLEELTSTEVRDAVAAGKTTVIVPVGGTEQSGPHIVLGKHNVRAHVLAGRIATALGNALVAPVVAYVPEGAPTPPQAHMRWAGTITVPESAFETVLEYAARSFKQHGFHDVVLIGDHGGYQKSLEKVAARLNREWGKGSPTRVHAVTEYYRNADVDFTRLLVRQGFSSQEIGTHAGLADTALSLAVDPSLVRVDRLKGPAPGPADGVTGDPRRAVAAAAQVGQVGLDLIVEHTRDAIRAATRR